jgi:hypoxanthine phosphoribosyltransferase
MKQVLNQIGVHCAILSMVDRIVSMNVEKPCFISILKGGVETTQMLLNSLPKAVLNKAIIGYMGLASYHSGTVTTEKIMETYPLDLTEEQMKGREIFLVDDVYDSGLTMFHATSIIKRKVDVPIHKVTLVLKTNPKVTGITNKKDWPEVVGFEYPDQGFLVGCGMGMGEKYRCLRELCELEDFEIHSGG